MSRRIQPVAHLLMAGAFVSALHAQAKPEQEWGEQVAVLEAQNRALRAEVERLATQVSELRHMVDRCATQQNEAEARATRIAQFLTDVLDGADPAVRPVKAKPMAARMRAALADIYDQRGEEDKAVAMLEAAREDLTDGDDEAVRAGVLSRLGKYEMQQGRLERARDLLVQAADSVQASGSERGDALLQLGRLELRTGDLARAEDQLRQALDVLRAERGDGDPQVAVVQRNLAEALKGLGKLDEAESVLRGALGQRSEGRSFVELENLRALAEVAKARGDLTRAAVLARRAYDSAVAKLGGSHPTALDAGERLGQCLAGVGDHAAAREMYERTLAERRKVQGERHPAVRRTAGLLSKLAEVHEDTADPDPDPRTDARFQALLERLEQALEEARKGAAKRREL